MLNYYDIWDANPNENQYLFGCCPCCFGYIKPNINVKIIFSQSITYLVIIQIIMYIISVIKTETPGILLEPSTNVLLSLGATSTSNIFEKHQFWRLFLETILHGFLPHILWNLFTEIVFILGLEIKWGTLKTLTIFFASSLISSMNSLALSHSICSCGPSGGNYGIFGTYLFVLAFSNQSMKTTHQVFILFMIISFILFQFMNADNICHSIGAGIGFILGTLCFPNFLPETHRRKIQCISIILIIFGIVFPFIWINN